MIAVIAGTGTLPLEACKNLIAQNKPFFVICLFPELNGSALQSCVADYTDVISQPVYKPSLILKTLQNRATTQALLIGKVDKQLLLKKLRFDWLALSFLASALIKSDQALMERIVALFAQYNIAIIRQDDILGSLIVAPGILCGKLDTATSATISFGLQTASLLATNDIGQTVVVKDTMVLAVEAIEGTDACIQRGIALGIRNVIVCKAAHAKQNKKFDLPTLGPETLANIQPGAIRAIAWQANTTLIAQRETFVAKATTLGITLVAY